MPVPTLIGDLFTTIASNSPSGADVPSVLDDHLRALAGFTAQLRDGTAFSGTVTVPTAVRVGGATQGLIGSRVGGGAGVAVNSGFDDVVIDSSGNSGLSVLSGASSFGAVLFGDSGSNIAGAVRYNHSTDELSLWASAASRATVSSALLTSTVPLRVTGATQGVIGVYQGTGSGATVNSLYDDIVIDSSNNAGLSLLSPSNGVIAFGDVADPIAGRVLYSHSADSISLWAGGAKQLECFTSSAVFQSAITCVGSILGNGLLSQGSGIGYTSGAGGTVVQATSKATSVTLNKLCGRITMNGAALAAGAVVSFTLNNSNIGSAAYILAQVRSGAATGGSYVVTVDDVTSGSCRISVRNVTGGSLSEAIVLSFVQFDMSDT